jgi:hypothetical protein
MFYPTVAKLAAIKVMVIMSIEKATGAKSVENLILVTDKTVEQNLAVVAFGDRERWIAIAVFWNGTTANPRSAGFATAKLARQLGSGDHFTIRRCGGNS